VNGTADQLADAGCELLKRLHDSTMVELNGIVQLVGIAESAGADFGCDARGAASVLIDGPRGDRLFSKS